jgi:hypothetical protein
MTKQPQRQRSSIAPAQLYCSYCCAIAATAAAAACHIANSTSHAAASALGLYLYVEMMYIIERTAATMQTAVSTIT